VRFRRSDDCGEWPKLGRHQLMGLSRLAARRPGGPPYTAASGPHPRQDPTALTATTFAPVTFWGYNALILLGSIFDLSLHHGLAWGWRGGRVEIGDADGAQHGGGARRTCSPDGRQLAAPPNSTFGGTVLGAVVALSSLNILRQKVFRQSPPIVTAPPIQKHVKSGKAPKALSMTPLAKRAGAMIHERINR
jgi:hypothetical protein